MTAPRTMNGIASQRIELNVEDEVGDRRVHAVTVVGWRVHPCYARRVLRVRSGQWHCPNGWSRRARVVVDVRPPAGGTAGQPKIGANRFHTATATIDTKNSATLVTTIDAARAELDRLAACRRGRSSAVLQPEADQPRRRGRTRPSARTSAGGSATRFAAAAAGTTSRALMSSAPTALIDRLTISASRTMNR